MYCSKLGEKAQVIVDTGHHLQGANIEHIVSMLLDEKEKLQVRIDRINKTYASTDIQTTLLAKGTVRVRRN